MRGCHQERKSKNFWKKIWFEIILRCLDEKQKNGEKYFLKNFPDFFLLKGKRFFQDWGLFLWAAGRCKTVTFGDFRRWTVFWAFLTTLVLSLSPVKRFSPCPENFLRRGSIFRKIY